MQMSASTAGGRAPRIPLTRERVLHAAVALADASGSETLSMRKLGEALGVEAMSLYNHVANKEDLLDGMIDVVFAEIDLPTGWADWGEWHVRNTHAAGSPRTTTSRSEGDACVSIDRSACCSCARFAGVAIRQEASAMPSRPRSCAPSCMSVTESL